MENRLDKVLSDFNTLANQFESDYLELYREEPKVGIILDKRGLEALILGAFAVDNHTIDKIQFDGDLKITLTKIEAKPYVGSEITKCKMGAIEPPHLIGVK